MHRMAPSISLAIVLFAALATAALRALARRPATTDENQPRTAVTSGSQNGAGHKMARRPGPPAPAAGVVEQMQHVFHELHAEGRHALCAVCDGQHALA
jgi:hypothetical protein